MGLVVAFLPASATAQGGLEIERLEVKLWPEYDRSAVLVIYRVQLSSSTILPAIVELPIPAAVGEPHAVAVREQDGSLLLTEYTSRVQGDWGIIAVETDRAEVWVEFYAELSIEGQTRNYTFEWPGGLPLREFAFEVQKPLGVKDFKLTPSAESVVGEDGLTYYRSAFGPQSDTFTQTITLSYTKPTPDLSGEALFAEDLDDLERLEVALWPEYDRPEVLVIYRAQLPSSVSLPTTVTLPIPSAVGEPHAVAVIGPDGSLLNADYNRRAVGDWAFITVESDRLGVWVEYYADLTIEGDQRSFTYVWPGGAALNSLAYEVQQPTGASEMRITPPGSPVTGESGLLYHTQDLGFVSATSTSSISLTYLNLNSELSVDTIIPGSSLVRPEATIGGTPDLTDWLPWVLGIAGILLLAIGGVLYFRLMRGDSGPTPSRRRRSVSRTKAKMPPREIDASPVFCHGCGTKGSVSDRYCRQCGTQLRR
jgi:hypothetical protein